MLMECGQGVATTGGGKCHGSKDDYLSVSILGRGCGVSWYCVLNTQLMNLLKTKVTLVWLFEAMPLLCHILTVCPCMSKEFISFESVIIKHFVQTYLYMFLSFINTEIFDINRYAFVYLHSNSKSTHEFVTF